MENGLIKSFERKSVKTNKIEILARKPLLSEFYQDSTVQVAKALLGKILIVRVHPGYLFQDPRAGVTAGRIVETEAYCENDPAAHSFRGKTPRALTMFGPPGVAYVYFIYGMYEMLNFVTEPEGTPGAVLIRGIEPLYGEACMVKRRKVHNRMDLTRGPGRLCRAMGISKDHQRQSLRGPSLYVSDDGFRLSSICQSPRIGIRVGTESLWRFFIPDHPFVSRSPLNAAAEKVAL